VLVGAGEWAGEAVGGDGRVVLVLFWIGVTVGSPGFKSTVNIGGSGAFSDVV